MVVLGNRKWSEQSEPGQGRISLGLTMIQRTACLGTYFLLLANPPLHPRSLTTVVSIHSSVLFLHHRCRSKKIVRLPSLVCGHRLLVGALFLHLHCRPISVHFPWIASLSLPHEVPEALLSSHISRGSTRPRRPSHKRLPPTHLWSRYISAISTFSSPRLRVQQLLIIAKSIKDGNTAR